MRPRSRRLAFALLLFALALGAGPGDRAEAAIENKDAYDLTAVEILRKVIVRINDNYVDPRRIDAKEMFLSALEEIERNVPEVVVDGNAREGRVKVAVGRAPPREFDFKDVKQIWLIPHRMRPVFEYIRENLISTEEQREIEYAPVNGMLRTLDPHSWFLKPDVYKEFKLQTRGEFGGLGFVISMRKERLTVMKVLKNTPAMKAGIKKKDHIVKIGDDSTINMDLNEAVSKLRGKPGTKVGICVARKGWPRPRRFDITRDQISIESVTARLLEGGVGYVRLSSFAGTTDRDMQKLFQGLKADNKGALKGLVLDLRGNGGGLLEQAHRVADAFVDSGVIVTTVGMSDRLREPKAARKDGHEMAAPMAVLVNSDSASAAEIVAGALKNLDRAVVIGRPTFGKGSVQVLYDDVGDRALTEEAALKLTIAQYLLPGDESIQEVGVVPDVVLHPARVDPERVDLFAPVRSVRERDYEHHFAQGFKPEAPSFAAAPTAKPWAELRLLRDEEAKKPGEDDEEKDGDEEENGDEEAEAGDEDEFVLDQQIRFARDFVLRAPYEKRSAMLESARAFVKEREEAEEVRIRKAVEAIGLDWSEGPKAGSPRAAAEVKLSPARPHAGDELQITVNVTNAGDSPLYRLHAWTACDWEKNPAPRLCGLLDRREFLFGKLSPGEKRRWTAKVKLPPALPTQRETVRLVFAEEHGRVPEVTPVDVDVIELGAPVFAHREQLIDTEAPARAPAATGGGSPSAGSLGSDDACSEMLAAGGVARGNGDGLAAPGEILELRVDVTNAGKGRAPEPFASIRNLGNEKVFIHKGWLALGAIEPGESATATFVLEVKPGFEGDKLPLRLEIGDRKMGELVTKKIQLPVGTARTQPLAGAVKAAEELAVHAGALASTDVLARLPKGSVLPVSGRAGSYLRVEWAPGRTGFVDAEATRKVPGKAKLAARPAPVVQAPPAIQLSVGADEVKVVDGDRYRLSGVIADPDGVKDVRVFVNEQKVFFKSGKLEGDGLQRELEFKTEFALKPGPNAVVVMAREDEDLVAQKTLVVRRAGPGLAQSEPSKAPAGP